MSGLCRLCGKPKDGTPQYTYCRACAHAYQLKRLARERDRYAEIRREAIEAGTAPTCECGCAGVPSISITSVAAKGHVKGEFKRFVHGHNTKPTVPPPERCTRCGGENDGANRYVCKACCAQERRDRLAADPALRAKASAAAVAWKQRNRERANEIQRLRQAKARKEQFVERVHPLILLERDDGVCGLCGEDVDPLAFQVDHIVPLSLGGEHSYANTQPAHLLCNARKGNRVAA